MSDSWAFPILAFSHPIPPTTLPSVIQDAVWDKQLTQKIPDVSVGPVLGSDNESLELPSPTTATAIPGTGLSLVLFCFSGLEEGLLPGSLCILLCGLPSANFHSPAICPVL